MPGYLNIDGIWSWHVTPRAVYSTTYNATFFAFTDFNTSGLWVAKIDHSVDPPIVTSFRLTSAPSLQHDDHNNPAVLVLQSGKILCAWTGHDGVAVNFRLSTVAGSIEAFGGTVSITDVGYTVYAYSSLAQLSAQGTGIGSTGRIYIFYVVSDPGNGRRIWHSRYSDDDGATWATKTTLYDPVSAGLQPYFEFHSNGVDRIDMSMQPSQAGAGAANGVYHLYQLYSAGSITYRLSDGTDITANLPFNNSADFTTVDEGLGGSGLKNYSICNVGGIPVASFVRFPDPNFTDHRYTQARWDEDLVSWVNGNLEITTGGDTDPQYIVKSDQVQLYYSGGIYTNPNDIDEVLVSRNIGGQFEIERWRTPNFGLTWALAESLTSSSVGKNVRPTYVHGTNPPIEAIWWRGKAGVADSGYTTFNAYSSHMQCFPVVTPPVIGQDNFNRVTAGTSIATALYSPQIGEKWNAVSGQAPLVSSAGRVYRTDGNNNIANILGIPNTANYRVQCDLYVATNIAGSSCGVVSRCTGGSTDTEYTLVAATTTNKLTLTRRVAGASTTLDATFSITMIAGSTHQIALEVLGTGADVTLKCYWDGALAVTVVDSNAARIVNAGFAGIRMSAAQGSDTTGTQIDNFIAYDLATAYTMTGPSTGLLGQTSSSFTVTPNGLVTTATITPSDGGAGGVFTPTSLTFTDTNTAQVFTYLSSTRGAKTISATNNAGLTDPANLTYTVFEAIPPVLVSKLLRSGGKRVFLRK